MPKSHDRVPLVVDRNPLKQLAVEVGQVGKLPDPVKILQQWIDIIEKYGLEAIKELTGLDLSLLAQLNPLKFFSNLQSMFPGFDLSTLDLSDPESVLALWASIVTQFLNPTNLLEIGGNSLENLTHMLGINIKQPTGTFDPAQGLVVAPVRGVLTLLDTLFVNLTKGFGANHSQAEVATAVAGTTDTVAGTASLLAQVVAAFGPGNPDADDYERQSSADLGINWNTMYSSGGGPLATPNGHDTHYSGPANSEFVTLKQNIQAATLHQTSSIILAQAIPAWGLFTPLPFGGSADVWIRCPNFSTFATRTGIRFRVTSAAYTASYKLSSFDSGAEEELDTGSVSVPSSGGIISCEGGAGGNDRKFVYSLNGSPIDEYVDSGLLTSVDPTYLFRGHGGRNNAGQNAPDIRQWTAQG